MAGTTTRRCAAARAGLFRTARPSRFIRTPPVSLLVRRSVGQERRLHRLGGRADATAGCGSRSGRLGSGGVGAGVLGPRVGGGYQLGGRPWLRWLWRVSPEGVFQVKVPLGLVVMVQPWRWVTPWWWRQSRARFAMSVWPSWSQAMTWWASHQRGGTVAAGEDAAAVAAGQRAALLPVGVIGAVLVELIDEPRHPGLPHPERRPPAPVDQPAHQTRIRDGRPRGLATASLNTRA